MFDCEATVTLKDGEVVKCNGLMGELMAARGAHAGETTDADGNVIGVIWNDQ